MRFVNKKDKKRSNGVMFSRNWASLRKVNGFLIGNLA